MLAGLDRLGQQIGAHLRRGRVEEHFIVAVFQRRIEVGREALDAVLARQRGDFLRVAADQYRVGHDPVAIRQRHAALLADRDDRTHEMLIESHAPGDAVHDDAEPAVAMRALLPAAICGSDTCILSTCKTTAPRLFWRKECRSGALRVCRSIGQNYGGYATVLTRSQQRHTVAACFLSWTLDAFDFFIMVFVLADIAKEFGTGMTAVTIAITLTLAARPLGALLFGYMADRIGRRHVLIINVLTFTVFEFVSGLAPSLVAFIIIRALFGVAMGGEWGVGLRSPSNRSRRNGVAPRRGSSRPAILAATFSPRCSTGSRSWPSVGACCS